MAKTYGKQALAVSVPSDAWLGYNTRYAPEGASQTFVSSSPLVFSSGYLVVGADPTTAIACFSLQAGHNTTAGAYNIPVLPAYNGLVLFGNFLGAAAADNVLAAADMGASFDLKLSSTLLGASSPGWYILDAAASACVKITSFASDMVLPNSSETVAVAGDTNARVTAEVVDSVYAWV
jgi:hypothetical protein